MELLAPAGNVENFFAALEAGADAVYVGAPGCNARNLSRDLRLDEIGAMVRHCRDLNKKIYIAANSLLLEQELPQVVETLATLEYLQPDALIVQDFGIINLLRYYFPRLKYHASTLMGAHNSMGVDFFSRLGCERVVLARELTLDEIRTICAQSRVEIEVFVHGAMCFSYSGLCLFSSYLGGKSGLRGRCVQPCRRSYSAKPTGKRGGQKGGGSNYLFSMNDLDGLSAVRDLREAGVSSLKIEGRLRSANYVENIVKAYRRVLDAAPDEYDAALADGAQLIDRAMSRKVSSGYFFSPQPAGAITPYHSGNLGLHLGRAEQGRGQAGKRMLRLRLKAPLSSGDRVRLHIEPGGERVAHTLKTLTVRGEERERGAKDETVEFQMPPDVQGNWSRIDVYKVDVASSGRVVAALAAGAVKKEIAVMRKRSASHIQEIKRRVGDNRDGWAGKKAARPGKQHDARSRSAKRRGKPQKIAVEWWLKTDSIKTLLGKLPVNPDRFLISVNRQNVNQSSQLKRVLGKQVRNVIWCLPPILVDKDRNRYRKHLQQLLRTGFRSFQIGHLSQVVLFEGERVFLSGDYTLNLVNSQALLTAAEVRLEAAQLCIESDRESLLRAVQGYKQIGVPPSQKGGGNRNMRLGLTVYGAPPLFTSRMDASFFQYDRPVLSPKKESFVIKKGDGYTQTFPVRPFSLLPYLQDLHGLGVDYVVADMTGGHGGRKEIQELADRLAGGGKVSKLSTFNYLGKLE